jgi:heterodisulfide reductase subunit A
MAQYPKSIPETISQASGAAARAATILSKETVLSSGAVAEVNEVDCIGCGICEKVCPYNAISLREMHGGKIASVIPAMCKGCGVCVSQCPTSTITHNYFTDQQISSQIEAAYTVPMIKRQPKVLAFLCHWCGYAGADLAGVSRIQYAPNVRAIRVMCSGRIHPKFVFEAFLNDIEGVIIIGCHVEDCHYISGVQHTIKMIPPVQKELDKIGIASQRILLEFCSAAEGARFAEVINRFASSIIELGPLKLNEEQKNRLKRLKEKKAESKKTRQGNKKARNSELGNTRLGDNHQ